MDFIVNYILAAIVFVVIDSLWIGIIANKFYKKQMKKLLLDKPKLGPAALFYALYIFGLVYFVLDPALRDGQWTTILANGALLGLVMYATYDLTNLATLKHWPKKVVAVDMAWGTFVTTAVAAIVFALVK